MHKLQINVHFKVAKLNVNPFVLSLSLKAFLAWLWHLLENALEFPLYSLQAKIVLIGMYV